MKQVGQVSHYGVSDLWLTGPHHVSTGDTLAVSWMNSERCNEEPPLRDGRMLVASVRGDGAIELTGNAAASIPAICHGECGDYVYRVDS